MADALRMTQENMARLQNFQEQTTQLHRQFLEGQAAAQRTFQSLVEQQQNLIQTSLGISPQTQVETLRPSSLEAQTAPVYTPPPIEPVFEHSTPPGSSEFNISLETTRVAVVIDLDQLQILITPVL